MISGTVPMFPVGVGERSLAIESRMEVRKRKIPVIPDRMPAVGFAGGESGAVCRAFRSAGSVRGRAVSRNP